MTLMCHFRAAKVRACEISHITLMIKLATITKEE